VWASFTPRTLVAGEAPSVWWVELADTLADGVWLVWVALGDADVLVGDGDGEWLCDGLGDADVSVGDGDGEWLCDGLGDADVFVGEALGLGLGAAPPLPMEFAVVLPCTTDSV